MGSLSFHCTFHRNVVLKAKNPLLVPRMLAAEITTKGNQKAGLKVSSKVLPIVTPAPPKKIIPHQSLEAFFELAIVRDSQGHL